MDKATRQQEAYEDGKASQIRGAKRLLPAKITYNPDRTDWISIADAWYRGFDEALLAEPVTTAL